MTGLTHNLFNRAPAPRPAAAPPPEGERREDVRETPWRLVPSSTPQAGRFEAIHQFTGRTLRLAAASAEDAWSQIELLNRSALEISA